MLFFFCKNLSTETSIFRKGYYKKDYITRVELYDIRERTTFLENVMSTRLFTTVVPRILHATAVTLLFELL